MPLEAKLSKLKLSSLGCIIRKLGSLEKKIILGKAEAEGKEETKHEMACLRKRSHREELTRAVEDRTWQTHPAHPQGHHESELTQWQATHTHSASKPICGPQQP